MREIRADGGEVGNEDGDVSLNCCPVDGIHVTPGWISGIVEGNDFGETDNRAHDDTEPH